MGENQVLPRRFCGLCNPWFATLFRFATGAGFLAKQKEEIQILLT
jgi:hypothetical protein